MKFNTRINDIEPRIQRQLTFLVQILIILSLISFSIETLPNLSISTRQHLRHFEIFTVAIFTIEYVVRVLFARKPLNYVCSFFGIVDLLAIAPFYLTTGLDLRSIRAFRLLRLFQILKLVRYSRAIQRIHLAFKLCREELILFACTSMILLYLSAVGIYYFENPAQPEVFSSVYHCLWWAVSTLTTVGYGDIVPITVAGKIFTTVILLIGIGIIAVPTALISSALSAARND